MATPITAEQCLQDKLDKDTKSDPVQEFLKQYEQQSNKTSTYYKQLYNSSNSNITQNKRTRKDT